MGSYRRRDRADPDPESGEEMTSPSNRSNGVSSAEAGGIQWEAPIRPPRARLPLRVEEIGQPMERSFTGQSAMKQEIRKDF
jgi:hypothetical protein